MLVAFVVVGPRDLPKVARWIARLIRKIRTLASQFKAESGLDEIEREINDTKRSIDSDIKSLTRETDITHDINEGTKEIANELESIR